jgi:hypothetical protein
MADTVVANRTKPLARPRWLIETTIGATVQHFSSEDFDAKGSEWGGEYEFEFGNE